MCSTETHLSQPSFLGKHVGVRRQQDPHKEAPLQVGPQVLRPAEEGGGPKIPDQGIPHGDGQT